MPKRKRSESKYLFQPGTGQPAVKTASTSTLDHEADVPLARLQRPPSPPPPSVGEASQTLRSSRSAQTNDINATMRILHQEKNINMWNKAIRDHFLVSKKCKVPQFHIHNEIKRGMCVSQSLSCQ